MLITNAFALDLSSTITSSSNRIQTGTSVTYTGTVMNNSSTSASNSQLIFYMPPRNVNYISLPVGCTIKVKITCLLGDLAGGASVSKSITVSYSSAGSAIVSALAVTDTADSNTNNNLSRLTTNVTKSIANNVTIPSISNVTPNPVSVTLGDSITFSTTLSGNLPNGYNVKLNYSNSSISMSGLGTIYSVVQAPTQLGQQVFTVGIYDSNNILKSNTLTGNFEVIKGNSAPTLSIIAANTNTTAGTNYSVQLQASDVDNNLKSISITWGDGATDTQNATNGTTLTFTHTYVTSGTYTYSATAYDSGNTSSTAIAKSVTVSATTSSASTTTGYTKISNTGAALPDTAVLGSGANDWACTKDNSTGLIWEVKTDDGELRDKDWRYSWYDPDASTNGGFAGYQNADGHPDVCYGSNCDTYAYKNTVNSKGLCGKNDWRLPTKDELMKLVVCSDGKYNADGGCTNQNTVTPTINTTYFVNTQSDWYWSSSPLSIFTSHAWFVYFNLGYSSNDGKGFSKFIRLVRYESVKLNDTGIANCSSATTNNLSCPISDFPNQDAQSGRDVTNNDDSDGHAGFSFTKISSTGASLPASATSWNCVKDNITGLMWEVKTTDGGLHDKGNTYTWYEPDNTKNGGSAGTQNGGACTGSQCDTNAYVSAVNTTGYCGYKDWRIPTRQELTSIIDFSSINPAIDMNYFQNTQSNLYWSSSPLSYGSKNTWVVNFNGGDSGNIGKNNNYFLRLVR